VCNVSYGVLAYHHLLGFDHFYFFYRDEVTILPNWDELVSHPVVTLIEWNNIGTLESYYNQASGTEVECLTKYAAQYDWVYIADIDEYLFLGKKDRTNDPLLLSLLTSNYYERINQEDNGYIITPYSSSNDDNEILTVKELLHIYNNMTYLSFGKRQYSLDHYAINGSDVDSTWMMTTNYRIQTVSTRHDNNHATLRPDTNFILSKYPYYMNSYFCHHRGHRRGAVICPVWRGRSKVMVRPQYHRFIDVHGTYGEGDLKKSHIHNGTVMHFHPALYHIKEWPHLYGTHNITIHYPSSTSSSELRGRDSVVKNNFYIDNYDNFTITNETEVSIHNIHTGYIPFYINEDNGIKEEIFLMKRDEGLQDYFQKVMNLATNAHGYPILLEQN
jgi:Glycosyltransferase family 92